MLTSKSSGRVGKWKMVKRNKKVPVDGWNYEKYMETKRLVQDRNKRAAMT